jgi:hypothetical protein
MLTLLSVISSLACVLMTHTPMLEQKLFLKKKKLLFSFVSKSLIKRSGFLPSCITGAFDWDVGKRFGAS